MAISDQLKAVIKASGETHYRIAKATGMDLRTLDRFMTGERLHIRSDTIDLVCDYLGLELRRKKRETAAKKAGKR